MERRQILRASLALCGGLTLSGVGAIQGAAEVIDLGASGSDLRVQSGVLDFGKTIPARQTREDVFVKHKYAMHLGTLAQGMEQCRVVMRAQIAPVADSLMQAGGYQTPNPAGVDPNFLQPARRRPAST